VSVVSGHRLSRSTSAAESPGFGRVGLWIILDYFSSHQPTKDRAKRRANREAPATIDSCAIESLERRRTPEPLPRIAATIWLLALLCAPAAFIGMLLLISQVFGAQGDGLIVSDAWVPSTNEVGRDVPLLVAIRNETDSPDALMRVRCPVANFFEKHTVDRGEGAPAMRPISSIPIPAGGTTVLKPTEYHVMLLQIRQPLAVGGRFNCTLIFQKAGALETEVEVR
jgi:copper(I)-binding protein